MVRLGVNLRLQMLFMLMIKMEEVDLVKVLGEKKSRLQKIVVSFARKKVTGQISAQ